MAHIYRDKNMLPRAKRMRKNMTPQESHLWYDYLRDYPIRWYRQRIINSYIVDFYCAHARLVVEIDGGQHYTETGQINDAARTHILGLYGLEVIRFTNRDVEKHFDSVCLAIDKRVKARMAQNQPGDAHP